MADYRVDLDIYNGPMDLLLYLIRRDEIDIHDIPISRITSQYLEYVELIKQLDINVAGDFLVMAASLMEVKSALLIPRQEVEESEGQEDLSDPRLELVRQLLEYKKFKDAAGELDLQAKDRSMQFSRSLVDLARLRKELKSERELDMDSMQVWDLFDTFQAMMKSTLANKHNHEVIHDDTPIDVYQIDILDRAQLEMPMKFEAVFAACQSRSEMVGRFIALLELIRQKLVKIEQEDVFSPIYVFPRTEEPAAQAVARVLSGGREELPSEINEDLAEKHNQTVDAEDAQYIAGEGEAVDMELSHDTTEGDVLDMEHSQDITVADDEIEDNSNEHTE